MRAKHRPLGVEVFQFSPGVFRHPVQRPEVTGADFGYVQTPEGRRTIYKGWWVVMYGDESVRAFAPGEFEKVFFTHET